MGNTNWKYIYDLAQEYNEKYKTLNLPNVLYYKGVNLGQWLKTQRENYSKGLLSNDRIALLNNINIEWENPRSLKTRWNRKYLLLVEYYNKYHHLFVPISYETESGVKLGVWLNEQRQLNLKGKLSKERLELLYNLDISWTDTVNTNTSFPEEAIMYYISKVFPNAHKYKSKEISEIDVFLPDLSIGIEYDGYKHQDVSRDIKKTKVCSKHNIKLIRVRENECPIINDGSYIITLSDSSYIELEKAIKKIFDYLKVNPPHLDIKKDYLDIVDIYIKKIDDTWYQMFEILKEYNNTFGNINVPVDYVTKDGIRLGAWLSNIRISRKNPDFLRSLTKEKIKMLNDLGMDWSPFETQWNEIYTIAENYYNKNGNLLIPDTCVIDGINIGRWIGTQRKNYKEGNLSEEKINKLNLIEMNWNPVEEQWQSMFNYLATFVKKNNSLNIPNDYIVDGKNLLYWLNHQRSKYREGKLNKFQVIALEKLGIDWNPVEDQWQKMYKLAEEYYFQNGNLLVPYRYVTEEDISLGNWISSQRKVYKNGSMSLKKINKLNLIEMNWNPVEDQWQKMYELAKKYYFNNHNLLVPRNYVTQTGENLGSWIANLRHGKENLDDNRIKQLNDIDMIWKVKMTWNDFYELAKEYFNENGNINIKCRQEYRGVKLGWWVTNQKRKLKEDKLNNEEKNKLKKLGIKL